MNFLLKYIKGVESISRSVGLAAMYLLLVVLAVLMFPVFVRGGDISTIWALETAQFAVGAYYLLGAGYSLQQGAHVRMDFLYANWKPRTKAIVDAITSFFVLFYLVVMLLGGWDSCAYAIVSKQINHTVWAPYMAPIKIAMFLGIFFMFLQMTAEFVKSLLVACQKKIELPGDNEAEDRLFTHRATRPTFWKMFTVCASVGAVGVIFLAIGIPQVTPEGGWGLLSTIVGAFLVIAAPIAAIPVAVRRFHDLDLSGWWVVGFILFSLIPGLGIFMLIAAALLLAQDGAPGTTDYGPDPKGRDLIRVFTPHLPFRPAPLPEAPIPAAPEKEHPYWTPYLVFMGVGILSAGLGFVCAAWSSNPTWFILGMFVFILSFVILLFGIGGRVCANRSV